MEGLNELEDYLKRARILERATFPNHGAHPSQLFILEGGVGALAKPSDATAEGADMVPREVAAWVLARALGWPDLMATTVLRRLEGDVQASLAVLWPAPAPDAAADLFPDEDVWRAAVFDFLITQSDRSGHNWLAVPAPDKGNPRLRLVDHGYAFDFPSRAALGSSFYDLKKGHVLPDDIQGALGSLIENPPVGELDALLELEVREKLMERAVDLADKARLPS